jgi:hypothetical protein
MSAVAIVARVEENAGDRRDEEAEESHQKCGEHGRSPFCARPISAFSEGTVAQDKCALAKTSELKCFTPRREIAPRSS